MNDLYEQVKKWIKTLIYVDNSSIRKTFGVGYNRADIIIHQLLKDHLIEKSPLEGRKYRIISDTQDSLKYDDYPMILEEGKQYKIALQSFYLLTCYGGGNGGLEITHILNLGRRNIKLRYDSNYFFAFNLNGIYYKPIP